jgi:hypothetical protein
MQDAHPDSSEGVRRTSLHIHSHIHTYIHTIYTYIYLYIYTHTYMHMAHTSGTVHTHTAHFSELYIHILHISQNMSISQVVQEYTPLIFKIIEDRKTAFNGFVVPDYYWGTVEKHKS